MTLRNVDNVGEWPPKLLILDESQDSWVPSAGKKAGVTQQHPLRTPRMRTPATRKLVYRALSCRFYVSPTALLHSLMLTSRVTVQTTTLACP